MAEFKVAMMSTCTHNGTIIHHKTYMDVYKQWKQYQVFTAKLEPAIGTILSFMILYGQQKVEKADQLTLVNEDSEHALLFNIAISWGNKIKFVKNMADLCWANHKLLINTYTNPRP